MNDLVWKVPLGLTVFSLVLLLPWRKIFAKLKPGTSGLAGISLPTSKIGTEVLTIALVVVGGILFWFFGWDRYLALPLTNQIAVALGCFGLFWMLNTAPKYSLATVAKYTGIFLLIFAGWNSGPGQLGLSAVDQANAAIVAGEELGCPDAVTLKKENTPQDKRPTITLRKGCPTKLVAQVDWEPQFTTYDKRFRSALSDYGRFNWKNRYLMEITPGDNFPEGDVEVHILTPEEASKMTAPTTFDVSAT